jgi:hypothetical protein
VTAVGPGRNWFCIFMKALLTETARAFPAVSIVFVVFVVVVVVDLELPRRARESTSRLNADRLISMSTDIDRYRYTRMHQ